MFDYRLRCRRWSCLSRDINELMTLLLLLLLLLLSTTDERWCGLGIRGHHSRAGLSLFCSLSLTLPFHSFACHYREVADDARAHISVAIDPSACGLFVESWVCRFVDRSILSMHWDRSTGTCMHSFDDPTAETIFVCSDAKAVLIVCPLN